jgi:hypothetical protein
MHRKTVNAWTDVISALSARSKLIPFRNSVLTKLTADAFSGNAKVVLMLHVVPHAAYIKETLETLQLGYRALNIVNHIKV